MLKLVSVDIGGTHARFARASITDDGAISLGEPVTLRTHEHAGLESAWRHFAEIDGETLPRDCALAVAGPVTGEVIRLTNSPWTIRPAQISRELGVDRFTLINDFGAVGHAVARAVESDFTHLCGPEGSLPASGTISVVGPGTGLGVAHLWRDGKGHYRVQSTEGGHIEFGPQDAIDDALVARLRPRYRRVSVERVVSGPGIVDIYETLAALESKAVHALDDRALWQAGTDGSDSLARAAIDRFCLSLGAAAGDYALAHGASGVVIAGGLGLRIRDTLLASGFASRFIAKGRYQGMMSGIPVKLITHPQPGLLGAAAAFAQEHPS